MYHRLSTPPASRRLRDRHSYGPTLLALRIGLLLSLGRGSDYEESPSGQNRCTGIFKTARLTSWTGKQSESGATGRESQACRAVNISGPLLPAKRRPPPNESEGVAGAKRYQGPGQPAAGRVHRRSEAGSERRPEIPLFSL